MARLLRHARMGGQRAGQLCSSLLSWESTGAHELVEGAWALESVLLQIMAQTKHLICQLGGIMLHLPRRTVVMINWR